MPSIRVLETRVLPATRKMLERFSHEELALYAESLGVVASRGKHRTITLILATGKATVLAQLGD